MGQEEPEVTTTTWWQVGRYNTEPEPMEVKSETRSTLMDKNGRLHRKRTSWGEWFPTWEQAHARQLKFMREDVELAEENLADAHSRLKKASRLRPPKGVK